MNTSINDIKIDFWARIPDELKLAIELSAPQKRAMRLQDLGSINQTFLLELIDRHRLLPVLSDLEIDLDLLSLPLLKQKLIAHKQKALLQTSEILRIVKSFNSAHVRVLTMKGPVMAQQLYNDITQRLSRDIDLLVQEKDLGICHTILQGLNYIPMFDFTARQLQYEINHSQHLKYYNHDLKILVELHWRFFMHKYLYPIAMPEVFTRSVNVCVASFELNTLCQEDLIFYLCLHGGYHSWFRLHWLRDIANLLHLQNTNWHEVIRKAKNYGIENSVLEAVILSHIIYNTEIPEELKNQVKSSSIWFIRQSLEAMLQRPYAESNRTFHNIVNKTRLVFHLRKSVRHRLSIWPVFNTRSSDWRRIKLPDQFFFLYFFLHPFLWFFRQKK